MKRLLSFVAAAALLQACAGAPRQADPAADDFAPVFPEAALVPVAAGTVYNPAASFDLSEYGCPVVGSNPALATPSLNWNLNFPI